MWSLHLFLACILLHSSTQSMSTGDRVWSQCNQTAEKDCKCGVSFHDAILCTNDSLQIQPCYCMFYDFAKNKTVAGICMFTCFKHGPTYYKNLPRYLIDNASQLNVDMCGSGMTLDGGINREGRFCGKCKKGYGLAAYSYHYVSCIPCENYSYINWLRYFAVTLLPLTLFYFVVVLLKINFTSSHLKGRVFAIQCILSPLQMRILDADLSLYPHSSFKVAIYGIFGFVGIMNLDFIRTVYPHFCLHQNINIVHVLTLDFIVALYPFFLILLTYFMVSMYDKNFCLLVWVWKPFKYFLGRYWSGANVKGSLVQTFASSILLSSVKILSVCFDLMLPARVHDATGATGSKYLYYDATIEYFGSEHWPYAILALCIGFVFVFLPFLLLVVYPCTSFQKALNCLGWRCQALHIFMDAFQGSYKTEPWDLRYFSAYYLFLRFLVLLLTGLAGTIFYILLIVFVLLISAAVFAFFEPYKDRLSNKTDVIILLSMVLFYAAYLSEYFTTYLDYYFSTISSAIFVLATAACTLLVILPSLLYLLRFLKLHRAFNSCKNRKTDENTKLIESFDRA